MNKFKITIGLDAKGNLIEPNDAFKKVECYCPLCYESLNIQSDKSGEKHFSHKGLSKCEREDVLKQAAKLLIFKAVIERKFDSKKQIMIKQSGCSDDEKLPYVLPEGINNAKIDVQLEENNIYDICLYKDDVPAVAIDISMKNDVKDKVCNSSIPYINLNAVDIIESHLHWFPINENIFGNEPSFLCDIV